MVRKFLSLALLAGTAAMAWSGGAAAQTATIQVGPTYAYDGNDSGGPADVSVIINPSGTTYDLNYSGNAGGINGVFAGTSAIFWCDDLYDPVTNSSLTYTVQSMVSGQKVQSSTGSLNNAMMTTLNTTTANQLNALLYNGQNYVAAQNPSSPSFSDQDYASAALQVAIWAFLYNGNSATTSILNSSSSVFRAGSSMNADIMTDAVAYLACIAGTAVTGYCGTGGWAANSAYSVKNVYLPYGTGTSGSPNKKQGYLVLAEGSTDSGGGTPVPEPASIALLGMGLAGLAALRRRR